MKRVIVDRSFSFDPAAGPRTTYPAGWRGEVEDDVAAALIGRKSGREVVQPEPDAAPAKRRKARGAGQ
ncbi:hypothetical protein V8J36_05325 [Frigidibacter sp. MR17.14]|uniref:hypothetical protein n=1 Tax=Frigidibacter sp. MR17.14 TaxID=3126509 RepID=UPI003012CBD4